MKKLSKMFMFALCASFVSCSMDENDPVANDNSLQQEKTLKELKPQAVTIITTDYEAEDQNHVQIINNPEALTKYIDAEKMPEVDWTKNCVIVGSTKVPDTGHTIVEPVLKEYNGEYVQEVTVAHGNSAYAMLTSYTFCYVYPKLSEKSIRLKINTNCECWKNTQW